MVKTKIKFKGQLLNSQNDAIGVLGYDKDNNPKISGMRVNPNAIRISFDGGNSWVNIDYVKEAIKKFDKDNK